MRRMVQQYIWLMVDYRINFVIDWLFSQNEEANNAFFPLSENLTTA